MSVSTRQVLTGAAVLNAVSVSILIAMIVTHAGRMSPGHEHLDRLFPHRAPGVPPGTLVDPKTLPGWEAQLAESQKDVAEWDAKKAFERNMYKLAFAFMVVADLACVIVWVFSRERRIRWIAVLVASPSLWILFELARFFEFGAIGMGI